MSWNLWFVWLTNFQFFFLPNSSFDDFASFFLFFSRSSCVCLSSVILYSELRGVFDLFFLCSFCSKNFSYANEKGKNLSKENFLYCSQQTMDRKLYEKLRIVFFLLTGSSRTTLKKTNDMAPMVCLYAIPCPVPCYICFYLYTTNLVHIHIDVAWSVIIRYITHTMQKKPNSHRCASHQFYSSSSSTVWLSSPST